MPEAEENVVLSGTAAERLIRCGSGDAALLYIALLKNRGDGGKARSQLRWDQERFRPAFDELVREKLAAPGAEPPPLPPPEERRAEYTRADVVRALENPEFSGLTSAVEGRLGKRLNTPDLMILLGLYDQVGLPADVIYLLVNFCAERVVQRFGEGRRPTLRQIEKEGYLWARLGLMTQELAVDYLKEYARKQTVLPSMMAALRLGGREPVARELEFLERWMEWGFSAEAVAQAYEQTVFKCGTFQWRYCNGILRDWDKKGLHTPEEIAAGDKPPRPAAARAQGRPARPGASQEDREQAREKERAAAVQESVAWMKEYLKETEEP